jgi:hypothetical protein
MKQIEVIAGIARDINVQFTHCETSWWFRWRYAHNADSLYP